MQIGERSRHNFELQESPFPLDSVLGIWSGLGIEGLARIFAEEMRRATEKDAREDNAAGRRAGKRKRMYICRLSERIKTERIANRFPFQSVDRRERRSVRSLLSLSLSLSLSSVPLCLSTMVEFFQIPRLSVFELNVKQSDSPKSPSVLRFIKFSSKFR